MGKRLVVLALSALLAFSLYPSASLASGHDIILKIGDQNEYVEQLQSRLCELGYLSGEVTGYFGTDTQQAIINYQQDHALTEDGKAGPVTLNSIMGGAFDMPVGRTGSDICADTYYPGDKGQAVAALQQQLKSLEYYQYNRITGYYGPVTKQAVERFQRTNGLKADGIAGPETLSLLSSGKAIHYCLYPGDRGRDVESLQNRLAQLGYFKGSATGYFGSATEKALKEFQAQNGLKVDAQAGKSSRALLYASSAAVWDGSTRIAGSNLPDPVSSADEMLKFADSLLDKKYVYNTQGPDTFDSAGFVRYVLKDIGISTVRNSVTGFSTVESWEKISNITMLLPGDLLFFTADVNSRISHTGIYIGGGQFIHASPNAKRVTVSPLTEYYVRNFSFARRVF
jgi:peptidoglycan hydrolase-like protein with peptidoglycan-binding domain